MVTCTPDARCPARQAEPERLPASPCGASWAASVSDGTWLRGARLNEFPDYYMRLAKMEAEAEANGAAPAE